MSASAPLTTQRVSELVLANRAIRAPYYESDHDDAVRFTDPDRGLQWGADAIPALLGLFRVDRDQRDDHADGWVGFARHWRGGTMRLDFDRFVAAGASDAPDASDALDAPDPVLVVTAIHGRAGEASIADPQFGDVELPDQVPTEAEWDARSKQYQSARTNDETDGSDSVQAFIAALPGWKRDVAARFDEIVEHEVPAVRRAVRYHQPFYGLEGEGWFASFGAFTKHVKLTFPSNTALDPEPPSGSGPPRQALDVTETDELDEELVGSWVRQAADDPGMNW